MDSTDTGSPPVVTEKPLGPCPPETTASENASVMADDDEALADTGSGAMSRTVMAATLFIVTS